MIFKANMSEILKLREQLNEISPALSLEPEEDEYYQGTDWHCMVIGKNFCIECSDELSSWLLLQNPNLKRHVEKT